MPETNSQPPIPQKEPIEPPTLINRLKTRKSKILLGFLIIFIFSGAVFGVYKFRQTQLSREEIRLRAGQEELAYCKQDSDCILAFRETDCCGCPLVVTVKGLENDSSMIRYSPKEGILWVRPSSSECMETICKQCDGFWPSCSNNHTCIATSVPAIYTPVATGSTDGWTTYKSEKYSYSFKYPNYPAQWVDVDETEKIEKIKKSGEASGEVLNMINYVSFYLEGTPINVMQFTVFDGKRNGWSGDFPVDKGRKKIGDYEFHFYSWREGGGGEVAEISRGGKSYEFNFESIISPDLVDFILSTFKFLD